MADRPITFPVLGGRTGADRSGDLVPLNFQIHLSSTPETIETNLRETLASDYQPINPLLDSELGNTISIVGSGPSLEHTWRNLQGDVYACNAAYGWLLKKGVVAKYCMLWDAEPIVEKFAFPNPDTTYLIGSRCSRKVFDALKGCKIIVWHAGGDVQIQELLEKHNRAEPMIGGGGAAVTRAMFIVWALGYRRLHLFGVDSSYTKEFTHVQKSVVDERKLEIYCNGEWFISTPWLGAQAEDFKAIAPILRSIGARITVHGSGMIPAIAKALEFDVDGESQWRRQKRHLRHISWVLWRGL